MFPHPSSCWRHSFALSTSSGSVTRMKLMSVPNCLSFNVPSTVKTQISQTGRGNGEVNWIPGEILPSAFSNFLIRPAVAFKPAPIWGWKSILARAAPIPRRCDTAEHAFLVHFTTFAFTFSPNDRLFDRSVALSLNSSATESNVSCIVETLVVTRQASLRMVSVSASIFQLNSREPVWLAESRA